MYDSATAQAYLHPSLFESIGDLHNWLWHGSKNYIVFAIFVPGYVKAVGLVRVNLNSGKVDCKMYVFQKDTVLEKSIYSQSLWWAAILNSTERNLF